MHHFLIKSSVFLIFCCALPAAALTGSWYERHSEGWHWYNEPPVEEEAKNLPSVSEDPKEESSSPLPKPTPSEQKPAGPIPFSSAWLEEMMPKYLSNAVDDPTPENVEAFFILQRLAMDKAERFQKVAEQVRIGNKLIDESERRPTSSFGLQTVDREAESRRQALLAKISNIAGLFFFYKEDCPFCEKQGPILKHLEGKGFDVLAISIGGGKLQTARFQSELVDSGQAAMLSVESTPSIFLVHPESTTFALIGSSLLSLPDLEERIILIAQRNQWITEEEVEATRPRLRSADGMDLSKKLPQLMKAIQDDPDKLPDLMALLEGRDAEAERKHLTDLPESEKRSLTDEKGFIDPQLLLQIVKNPQKTELPEKDSLPAFPTSFEER